MIGVTKLEVQLEVQGYKVALVNSRGRYCSSLTLQTYCEGKVSPASFTERRKRLSNYVPWAPKWILTPGRRFYVPEMKGRTCLYSNLGDALEQLGYMKKQTVSYNEGFVFDNMYYRYVLLEMKIKAQYRASFKGYDIYFGDEILNIKPSKRWS